MSTRRKMIACVGIAAALFAGPATARAPGPEAGVMRLAQNDPARATVTALRKVIGDLQRGTPDAAGMEPALYAAMQGQKVAALLAPFGTLREIEFSGEQDGADVYRVTFENAASLWTIRLSPSGRIAGLFFKPIAAPETAGEDVAVAGLSGTLLKPGGIERPPVMLLIA